MRYSKKFNPFTGKFDLVADETMFHMKDPVATYNNLPITGNVENDVRFVKDTDDAYVWSIANSSGNLTDWKILPLLGNINIDNIGDGTSYKKVSSTKEGQIHEKDKDTKLDEGGGNEIAVTEITKKATSNITYYINCDTGDDGNPGTNGEPFATIQKAVDLIPDYLAGKEYYIKLQTSQNYNETVSIIGKHGGLLYIVSATNSFADVLISNSSDIFTIKNCDVIRFVKLSMRVTGDNTACITSLYSAFGVGATRFGDNNNLGTKGINSDLLSITKIIGCTDLDANKVSTGICSSNAIVNIYNSNFGDTRYSVSLGGSIMDGMINFSQTDYEDAVAKKHDQNSDTGTSENFDIVGEVSMKVYTQESEPTLGQDNRMAIWIDSNDSNRVYLLFKRGSADQVKIELI